MRTAERNIHDDEHSFRHIRIDVREFLKILFKKLEHKFMKSLIISVVKLLLVKLLDKFAVRFTFV